MNDKTWLGLMKTGEHLGCHQMPERSFFYKGYQFPVCARCTGVILSSFFAVLVFTKKKISPIICALMSGVMFADWFIQRIGIKPSTNRRRFLTGLIGGFGYATLHLHAYNWLWRKLKALWHQISY